MSEFSVLQHDPKQWDYINEGPRASQLWKERYVLFLQDVSAVFDGFKALDIADLGIGHNELRVVVGPNGAGKTTMCDVISGLTKPATGKVYFDGHVVSGLADSVIAGRGVGRKFQIPNVFDSLTVWENMLLALPNPTRQIGTYEWYRHRIKEKLPAGIGTMGVIKLGSMLKHMGGRQSSGNRDKIEAILKRVHLIDELDTLAKNLSHGQRQWLAISSLILSSPKLLLVDEPAAGLTDSETALTAELLLELKNEHTIICIEHDMEFVRRLDSRVTVLDNGKVLSEGTLDYVQKDPAVIEAYLGKMSMLSVTDLQYSYGSVQTVRGVSIDVPAGQVTCVIGRNGVGKTTLLKSIMGVLKQSGGQVCLGGRDITSLAANLRAKAGVAWVPQGRMIFPKLTIEENLKVGLQARTDGMKSIPPEVYDTFPVLKQMNKRMGGDLSGGQQQQLAIARALVGDPKALLLDEPTEGIQPNIIQQIGHILGELVKQKNMAVLLVEQYLDFVKEFGRSFYVMNRGKVVAQGTTAELSDAVVSQHLGV